MITRKHIPKWGLKRDLKKAPVLSEKLSSVVKRAWAVYGMLYDGNIYPAQMVFVLG